ncbi:hypothetical protein GCM10023320_11820 [Pseudonocardia adelaidensis]|uniref:Uncharacterized protein n=1 Tax=Pseudonocardia adelaidensis TaxID=648754 RepID=A0ABP9NEJ8_9PSEU
MVLTEAEAALRHGAFVGGDRVPAHGRSLVDLGSAGTGDDGVAGGAGLVLALAP